MHQWLRIATIIFDTMPKKAKNSLEQPSNMMSDLISIAEAARLRDVSHSAIQNLIRREKLSVIEIGGRRFLHRHEVLSFEPEPIGRPRSKSKNQT
jgi:hypothetical protein